MKKVMNDVAVATLLFTMKPQTEVEIFDAPQYIIPSGDPITSVTGTTYTADEILHSYQLERIARAKIYRTEIKNGKLFLLVDTRNETY